MAKKYESMDLKKIIADAEKYQEAVMEANTLGGFSSPSAREYYDIAKELYSLALKALQDKVYSFECFGRDLGFVDDDADEDVTDERQSA
jgi:hypothetical protein